MSISWHTFSLISLFIISMLIMHIISKMYLFCSLSFVNHSIILIFISECMSLLILMSTFIFFFSMFLDISLTLILCIITSKLILCRHAFNNISLIQKLFFFSVFLCSSSWFKISAVSIISSSSLYSYVLTASCWRQSFSFISLCFSLLSSWFSLLLLSLWWRSLLQISCNDFALTTICWRWTQDDFQMMSLTSCSLSSLSCQHIFSSSWTFFQVYSLFFSVSSADSSCADWQSTQWHVDTSAFLSSLSNFSSFLRASIHYFYVHWVHKVFAACIISSVYLLSWLNSSARWW